MDLVVNLPPLLDLSARIFEASENVLIEALIAKSRIERFNEGVLVGLSWRNELVLDRRGVDPVAKRIGVKFWPVVAPE